MNYVQEILNYITYIVTVSSLLRIALHWLRRLPLLLYLIPDDPKSKFWGIYGAIELSLAYISISLAALGKQKAIGTLLEPVTEGAKGEGEIKP